MPRGSRFTCRGDRAAGARAGAPAVKSLKGVLVSGPLDPTDPARSLQGRSAVRTAVPPSRSEPGSQGDARPPRRLRWWERERQARDVRRKNFERSAKAGVPVGTEGDVGPRRSVAGALVGTKNRKKKRKGPKVTQQKKIGRKKGRTQSKTAKADLMNRGLRLPGSFESGRR